MEKDRPPRSGYVKFRGDVGCLQVQNFILFSKLQKEYVPCHSESDTGDTELSLNKASKRRYSAIFSSIPGHSLLGLIKFPEMFHSREREFPKIFVSFPGIPGNSRNYYINIRKHPILGENAFL